MSKKKPILAIAYDFDGTLAPGNMQERDFIPSIGMTTDEFWEEVKSEAKEQDGDQILIYMKKMLDKARSSDVSIRRENFRAFGEKITFFDGVENWFGRINEFSREHGFQMKHYIISSGMREMIEGTSIRKHFDKIYASGFMYDVNDVATWPALCVNYTTKTQYLFRINKGKLNETDPSVNDFVPQKERPIPFENMIFIGDGATDIPCFRTVKDLGGLSIAVKAKYNSKNKELCDNLLRDDRVQNVAFADYVADKKLDKIVKAFVLRRKAEYACEKIQAD